MSEGLKSWSEELASLVEHTGIRHTNPNTSNEPVRLEWNSCQSEPVKPESLKDQVKEFAMAWVEMLRDLGIGCRDIVKQSILTDDSFIVRICRGPCAKASSKLKIVNEYLPEDRDPTYAWLVIFFVFIIAFAVLNVNHKHDKHVKYVKQDRPVLPPIKKMYIHPPSASRVLLPDGRHIAYHEQGASADMARFTVIYVHSFLSSRLAGIPGVKASLLKEFGVRFITYDLPGFGESDPHPKRNLNTSAFDISYLANAVGVNGEFWVFGFSTGSMHALATLKYIPYRIAGIALFAPMVNPYDPKMTKVEMSRTWGKWVFKRKFMYFLARRFPIFLTYFYQRSFLSGNHGKIDKWLFLSLGNKDKALIQDLRFEELWNRDVEESTRQRRAKPFIEEATMHVLNWGFSITDLQVQKKCHKKGMITWLKSIYRPVECVLSGFQGPIHIWQGMNDLVVPPSLSDYIARVVPSAKLHKLPNEGHFSYFFFCEECHKKILLELFGNPQVPHNGTIEIDQSLLDEDLEEEDDEVAHPANYVSQ